MEANCASACSAAARSSGFCAVYSCSAIASSWPSDSMVAAMAASTGQPSQLPSPLGVCVRTVPRARARSCARAFRARGPPMLANAAAVSTRRSRAWRPCAAPPRPRAPPSTNQTTIPPFPLPPPSRHPLPRRAGRAVARPRRALLGVRHRRRPVPWPAPSLPACLPTCLPACLPSQLGSSPERCTRSTPWPAGMGAFDWTPRPHAHAHHACSPRIFLFEKPSRFLIVSLLLPRVRARRCAM